jgi:hypothetical protein
VFDHRTTLCCGFVRFEEDGVYGRTAPGINYVHKKDEWLGYGDYAVVSVSGEKLPGAINKSVRACGRQSSPGESSRRLSSHPTTHFLQQSQCLKTSHSELHSSYEALEFVVPEGCIKLWPYLPLANLHFSHAAYHQLLKRLLSRVEAFTVPSS